MVNRTKTSSTTGASQRAAIACQSCRLRKVKASRRVHSSREAHQVLKLFTPSATHNLSLQMRHVVLVNAQETNACWILYQMEEGSSHTTDESVSRKYVDRLQRRIETLEALNGEVSGRVDPVLNSSSADEIVPSNAQSLTRATIAATNDVAQHQNTMAAEPAPPRVHSQAPSAPRSVHVRSPENSSDEALSFYGATSHPHVGSSGGEASPHAVNQVDNPSIDLDPNSTHLREQLIHSFLKYQTLWVEVVDRETFLFNQASGRSSRWFCSFLENTVLACAARLSTSKAVRALGTKYYESAKQEVLAAISEPTPANLQGFLLLSEYEVTQGNDRVGWMFCGVACRMLSDLGLHELATTIDRPNEGRQPNKESDLAYALLSACVVYEGVWTLYLGRPSSIPKVVMDIVTLRLQNRGKQDSPWLSAWLALCEPMAEISSVLNEQSGDPINGSATLRLLSKQVEEWYNSLPPDLTYKESRLTNMDLAAYGLHTQYCKIQILLQRSLDRPSNIRKRRYSQMTSDKNRSTCPKNSNVTIHEYAERIARLIVTYREAFGVEKIPSIMLDNAAVAATAMIEYHHHQDSSGANGTRYETTWLVQLLKSMETVQPHFPVAGRMLDTLKQNCNCGLLGNMLYPARRDSHNARNLEPLAGSRPARLGFASNPAQEGSSSNAINSSLNFVWDGFDASISANTFLSNDFDDFSFDIPQPEILVAGGGSVGIGL